MIDQSQDSSASNGRLRSSHLNLPNAVEVQRQLSELSSAHLDAVHRLAALAVFLDDWRALGWPRHSSGSALAKLGYFLTRLPHLAVMTFFILSGFLTGGSVVRSLDQWRWSVFLVTRLSRSWVVLLPALVIGLALDAGGPHMFGGPHYAGRCAALYYDIPNRIGASALACYAAFVQTILWPTLGTNSVLWSLANEFWHYILSPLIVLGVLG